jgi:hypothetical protein
MIERIKTAGAFLIITFSLVIGAAPNTWAADGQLASEIRMDPFTPSSFGKGVASITFHRWNPDNQQEEEIATVIFSYFDKSQKFVEQIYKAWSDTLAAARRNNQKIHLDPSLLTKHDVSMDFYDSKPEDWAKLARADRLLVKRVPPAKNRSSQEESIEAVKQVTKLLPRKDRINGTNQTDSLGRPIKSNTGNSSGNGGTNSTIGN